MKDENLIIVFKVLSEIKDEEVSIDNVFKKVEQNISWVNFCDVMKDFQLNGYLEGNFGTGITKLGIQEYNKLTLNLEQQKSDEDIKRRKLHNETKLSGLKVKTFWYIFFIGLFGGAYSFIDLSLKVLDKLSPQEIKENKLENTVSSKEKHIYTLIRKNQDTLLLDKTDIDSLNTK